MHDDLIATAAPGYAAELEERANALDDGMHDERGEIPAPPVSPPVAILTEGEALMVRSAMVALKELGERLNTLGYKAPTTNDARVLGRLVGLLEVASDVTFDVLNCASSHGNCSIAARAIGQHLGR